MASGPFYLPAPTKGRVPCHTPDSRTTPPRKHAWGGKPAGATRVRLCLWEVSREANEQRQRDSWLPGAGGPEGGSGLPDGVMRIFRTR